MHTKAAWVFFVFLAVGVGLYPLLYLFADMSGGLLATKSPALLAKALWKGAFYTHISLGGVALLTGWSQFRPRFRARHLALHRALGKVYIASVTLSGLTGLYIAFYATGGWVSSLGFGTLAVLWVGTTLKAYELILKRAPIPHKHWMMRSYALCFAAVTLRLWLPLLMAGFHFSFMEVYPLVAWLCWVPNLLVAEALVRKKFRRPPPPGRVAPIAHPLEAANRLR